MAEERIAPSVRYVRSLPGKYYLLREASELLGVSHRTLRNLIQQDSKLLGPSFFTYLGKIKIYLYTEEDITRLREYLDSQRQVFSSQEAGPTIHTNGRPAKWTPAQRKARQRMFSQVHYYKSQIKKYTDNNDTAKAEKAYEKMKSIKKKLRDQDFYKTYGQNEDD